MDRTLFAEILAETMNEHGVDEDLVDAVVADAIERLEAEFDLEFDEDEDFSDDDSDEIPF